MREYAIFDKVDFYLGVMFDDDMLPMVSNQLWHKRTHVSLAARWLRDRSRTWHQSCLTAERRERRSAAITATAAPFLNNQNQRLQSA